MIASKEDCTSIKYKINVLQELKEHGYNTTRIRKEHLLPERVVQQLREGKLVTWLSIARLCRLLGCQPGDIVEYVPEEEDTEDVGNVED